MDTSVKVDCHVHSLYSGDARTPLDAIEEAAVAAGIDVVCIVDHGSISGGVEAAATFEKVRVVVGQECRTYAGEIIGLFLEERIPGGLKPGEVIAAIREQGGIVYLPHPFCPEHKGLGSNSTQLDEGLAPEIDVVEVHNAKATTIGNERAADFAVARGIAAAAASDAHYAEFIGRAYVEIPDFADAGEFLASLRSPSARLVKGTYSHSEAVWPRRIK